MKNVMKFVVFELKQVKLLALLFMFAVIVAGSLLASYMIELDANVAILVFDFSFLTIAIYYTGLPSPAGKSFAAQNHNGTIQTPYFRYVRRFPLNERNFFFSRAIVKIIQVFIISTLFMSLMMWFLNRAGAPVQLNSTIAMVAFWIGIALSSVGGISYDGAEKSFYKYNKRMTRNANLTLMIYLLLYVFVQGVAIVWLGDVYPILHTSFDWASNSPFGLLCASIILIALQVAFIYWYWRRRLQKRGAWK